MFRRFLIVTFFVLGASVLVASDATAQRSCVSALSCGAYSSTSGCWCDDGCLVYRDCCDDRVQICKVPAMAITSVTPVTTPATTMFPTNFTGTVTIKGSGLYLYQAEASVASVTVGGVACTGVFVSSWQTLSCMLLLPPHNTTVEVTTNWANSGLTSGSTVVPGKVTNTTALKFMPPSVTSVLPATGSTAGGYVMQIAGANFGTAGAQVTVGGATCAVLAQTHTLIQCTAPPGTGVGQPVVTTTRGETMTNPFSYLAPTVTSLSPPALPTAGGTLLTIAGSNLGTTGASVTVGGYSCPISSQTHTQIVCTAPAGQGNAVPVHVYVAGQSAALRFTAYQAATITSVFPSSGPAAGGNTLTLNGTNFGQSGIATIAGLPCSASSWTHTQIVCTVPPGNYPSQPVQLSVAGQLSNTAAYSYIPAPYCSPNQFVSGGVSCQPCAAGTSSPGGSALSCVPIVCPAPQLLDLATNSCACAPPPSGFYLTNAATCAMSPIAATLFLRAECTEPDLAQPGSRLIHFGYLNNYGPGGAELVRPYGAGTNTVTIDGVDAGPLSGAPSTLEFGARSRVFAVRYSSGQSIVWSVLDPVTQTMATATPAAGTPACTTLTAGPMGPQGTPGLDGVNGVNGPAGNDGLAGDTGLAGSPGAVGDPGAPGPAGIKGLSGLPGVVGPEGQQGADGAQGAQGPRGSEGPMGVTGTMGPQGAMGPTGPQGDRGPQGATGATGPQGPVGAVGPDGVTGPIGDRGAAGTPGATGTAGSSGPVGPAGPAGQMGLQGPQGPAGATPTGFWLYLREGEAAPAGYVYVRSYVEKLDRERGRDNDGRDRGRNDDEGERGRINDERGRGRDDDDRDRGRDDDERQKEIVIRVYRKAP